MVEDSGNSCGPVYERKLVHRFCHLRTQVPGVGGSHVPLSVQVRVMDWSSPPSMEKPGSQVYLFQVDGVGKEKHVSEFRELLHLKRPLIIYLTLRLMTSI